MSRPRARRRRRGRAHAHVHEHDRRRARGAPAREAVRADPEQPVHRVPVPARPRAAGRRRDDRALHGRLGRPARRDQRVHRATTSSGSRRTRSVTVMHLGTDVERFSPVDRDAPRRDPPAPRPARRRVRRAHRAPALLPQRARHAARRGDAPPRSAGAAHRDRRIRTRARRDRSAASAATASRNVHLVGLHPRRRSARLLPRRRRVRAADAHGRGLRSRADGGGRDRASRRSRPTRARRARSSTTASPGCSCRRARRTSSRPRSPGCTTRPICSRR